MAIVTIKRIAGNTALGEVDQSFKVKADKVTRRACGCKFRVSASQAILAGVNTRIKFKYLYLPEHLIEEY